MNRVFFFLFLLLTYYVAGSYRSVPLMIACIAEVVLSVLMFVVSWYLKKGLQIRFGKKYDTVRTGQTYRCNLRAENQSRIPSRFKVSFQIYSPFSSEKVFFQSSADCNQEDESFLYIRFPYCGLYTVEMRKIWIYDPIQLFRRRKKCKEVFSFSDQSKEDRGFGRGNGCFLQGAVGTGQKGPECRRYTRGFVELYRAAGSAADSSFRRK